MQLYCIWWLRVYHDAAVRALAAMAETGAVNWLAWERLMADAEDVAFAIIMR